MERVPEYHRQQLPPAPARVKPSYWQSSRMAQQRGMIEIGETIAGFFGNIFENLIKTRASNERHEFLGQVDAAQESFRGFLRSNPGASFEEMAKERDRVMTEITQAGEKLTLPSSKRWATDWYSANENLIKEKIQSDIEDIVSEHEFKRFQLSRERLINSRRKKELQKLYQEMIESNLIEEQSAQISMELDLAKIDDLADKDNKALAVTYMQKQAFQIAAEQGYEKAFDWLGSPETSTQLLEFGIPAEEQQQLRNILKERLKTQQQKEMDVTTDQRIKAKLEDSIYDIWTGAISLQDFQRLLTDARYPEEGVPKIDDSDFDELMTKAQTEFKSYQSKALQEAMRDAEKQIITMDDSAFETFMLIASNEDVETASNRRQLEYWKLSEFNKEMRDWLAANPKATRDEIYVQNQILLSHYRKIGLPQIRELISQREQQLSKPTKRIETYDFVTRQKINEKGERVGSPVGLEDIWDDLNKAEKDSVLKLLKYTDAESIKNWLKEQSGK